MGVCVSEHEFIKDFWTTFSVAVGCFMLSVTIMYLILCFQYVFRKGNGKL